MKKYLFDITVVFFAFQSCQHNDHKVSKQPNVVFIITDDQQLKTFGFLETTNLADDPAMAGKLEEMKGLLKKNMQNLPGTFTDMLD
jgi:hypothetical protein